MMLATPQASLTAANPVWRTFSISPVSNPPTSLTGLLGATLPGNREAPGSSLSVVRLASDVSPQCSRTFWSSFCCWLASLVLRRRLTKPGENSQRRFPLLPSSWPHWSKSLLPSSVKLVHSRSCVDPVSAPTWKIFSESLFKTFITLFLLGAPQSLARWRTFNPLVGD